MRKVEIILLINSRSKVKIKNPTYIAKLVFELQKMILLLKKLISHFL